MSLSSLNLCQKESRRLLLPIAVTVATLMVVQYFELPSTFSPLFSSLNTETSSFMESSENSHPSGSDNVTCANISQSSSGKEESTPQKEGSNLDVRIIECPSVFTNISNATSFNGPVEISISPVGSLEPANASAPTTTFGTQQNDLSTVGYNTSDAVLPLSSPSIRNPATSLNSNRDMNFPATKRKKRKNKRKRIKSSVISISQMKSLLLQSMSPSSQVKRLRRPSDVDKDLLFAKSEIEKARIDNDDAELYGPIYHNVSKFKRSYELMEEILKVYVYQDGEKPIFHEPMLVGIYASEGWFMKHMEASEKFVTNDPKRAHLFYIPFSSKRLKLTLYKRQSHNRKNLVQFMTSYVDMLAAKYDFWNRTGGTDHFVAACHDSAPAETRGKLLNGIRALCNADINLGFRIGKDVSLPETNMRPLENPLKPPEGNPPSQRPFLAFFAGQLHGHLRPILLQHWGNKDPDMKIFGPIPRVKGNTNYINHMRSSKYCICPRGFEVNSPRIVEAILHECVPVIISDNYVPPFLEILNWESFAVFVLEKDVPDLKSILNSIPQKKYREMHYRVQRVKQHFMWHSSPVKYDLFHMVLHSIWYNRVFQIIT